MTRITFISDTHNKHRQISNSLPGGDIIIHAGDISSMGYKHEIRQFLSWYKKLDHYTHKIFIAGNHDWGFQTDSDMVKELMQFYDNIIYLQDNSIVIDDIDESPIKIYGSPWQPEFFDWAFNLPRNGKELKQKWDSIPNDTDILITHGPSHGHLDQVIGRYENLGCELLRDRVNQIKPKFHVFGHIHTGYGYKNNGDTHFINASVLDENYYFTQKPLTVDWDIKTNEINFI